MLPALVIAGLSAASWAVLAALIVIGLSLLAPTLTAIVAFAAVICSWRQN
jgi:hypothetical protein